uniref:Uncharacterized protein n=1 Tax=Caenorhabditis japonica TaxID=281687 RepID=A0A8R1IIF7_CAEJA
MTGFDLLESCDVGDEVQDSTEPTMIASVIELRHQYQTFHWPGCGQFRVVQFDGCGSSVYVTAFRIVSSFVIDDSIRFTKSRGVRHFRCAVPSCVFQCTAPCVV